MTVVLFCENKSKVYDDSIFHLYNGSKYPQWKTFLEHSFQFALSIKWVLRKACNEKNWHGEFISFYWPFLSLLPTRAERSLRSQPTSLSAAGYRSPSSETPDSGMDVFTMQSKRALAPSICSSRLFTRLTLNSYHFKPEGDNEKGCSLNSERSYSLLR